VTDFTLLCLIFSLIVHFTLCSSTFTTGSYFVLPAVKQASFTGSQLLGGSTNLGLMAAGLFGLANLALVKAEALAAICARHQGRGTGDAPTDRAVQESVGGFFAAEARQKDPPLSRTTGSHFLSTLEMLPIKTR